MRHLMSKFQNFLGGACPQTPLVGRCAALAKRGAALARVHLLTTTLSQILAPPSANSWIRPCYLWGFGLNRYLDYICLYENFQKGKGQFDRLLVRQDDSTGLFARISETVRQNFETIRQIYFLSKTIRQTTFFK